MCDMHNVYGMLCMCTVTYISILPGKQHMQHKDMWTMQAHTQPAMIYNMSQIVLKHLVRFTTCFKTWQCEQFCNVLIDQGCHEEAKTNTI